MEAPQRPGLGSEGVTASVQPENGSELSSTNKRFVPQTNIPSPWALPANSEKQADLLVPCHLISMPH